MKGERVETETETTSSTMFSKLPQHRQHQQLQQPQLHPFAHHPFQLSRECQTSEEDDSRSNGGQTATVTPTQKGKTSEPGSTGDGASIEVVRRRRGRPPGSKNKLKPPVIITREPEPGMSPYILEIPGGCDVVEAIARFCRCKNLGLCILTGLGTVANVTFRQPSTTPGSTVTFHGRFNILSVSATFIPQQTMSFPAVPKGFTISLAGPQGQIVGGLVAGGLVAAGTVFVFAASFNNPLYHTLPLDDEVRASISGGDGDGSSPCSDGGGDSGHVQAESGGMSIYSCHVPSSDMIWAPTASAPPPY